MPSSADVRAWLLGVLREARVMGYSDVEDLMRDLSNTDDERMGLGLDAGAD